MKYLGYMPNDFVNGEGVVVSLWTTGCPHRCFGCHNPESWDYDSGYDVPYNIKEQINMAICANGIQRNFSVLGGEPLCPENLNFVNEIVSSVREQYPSIKIFLWTGYKYEYFLNIITGDFNDNRVANIFKKIDTLIEGPYENDKRDVTLKLRGSKNQRIINMRETLERGQLVLDDGE